MVNPITRRISVEDYNNVKKRKYGIGRAATAVAAALARADEYRVQTDSFIADMNAESQPSPASTRDPVVAPRPNRGLPARLRRSNRINSTGDVEEAGSDSDSDSEGGENNQSFKSLSSKSNATGNRKKRSHALTAYSSEFDWSEDDEDSDQDNDSDEDFRPSTIGNKKTKKQAPRKVSF